MSETSPSAHQAPIPEELQKQLTEFQRHLWRVKITEAILAGIFGLMVSFLAVFLLERLFPMPPLARFGILIAGTSLSAVFAPLMVRRWVFGHRREEQLARLIAKKFPKIGDRLLGIVELQDQSESRETLSPELRAAAMEHVARQAAKWDMTEALPNSRHRKLALGVAFAALATIVGFIVAPKAGSNALVRWALPFTKTEHYTFTQFDTGNIPNPLV
ncbi:GtrA family protein, partial [Akkermansiaceae bacterium]|nr:GtrA family protein [Akkermansiaceae bacterium]